MKNRAELLKEVQQDTSKSNETLLTDVYEELLNHPERMTGENAAHAAKRFSALLGKSIIEASRATQESLHLQRKVESLTRQLMWLTVVLLLIGLFTLYSAISHPSL